MPNTTDTVKAILTPGEFVIRKEAVDMIGVPTLEKLNDMPEVGGHSEIDRLIAQATLKNMTGMYGGGVVKAEQYGTGGMVNQYQNGGQAMSNLKPVPDNNPGLAKLPEGVRNKMGYMQNGGLMEMMHGGKAKKKKEMYSYEDGGLSGYQDGGFPESLNMDDVLKRQMLMKRFGNVFNQELDKSDRIANFSKARRQMDLNSGLYEEIPNSNVLSGQKGNLTNKEYSGGMKNLEAEQDMLIDMFKSSLTSRQPEGMQYGGLSGYQDGGQPQQDDAQVQAMMQQQAMMQREQPSPFVPFDQRPPSSGDTMSSIPMGMQQGDYMRSLRGELEMENEELTQDKMENFFERLRLDSLSEKLEKSMFEKPSMSRADSISDRDLMEFLKLQNMKRGADATIQGMNNNPEGLFR